MNNSINLRPLFFLKWSNKQHHHYNDIYPIKNICNCIAPRKTCLWVIQGNKDKTIAITSIMAAIILEYFLVIFSSS